MPYDIGLETPECEEEIVCPECGWESEGYSCGILNDPPPYDCPVCGHILYDPEDFDEPEPDLELDKYSRNLEFGGHTPKDR